MSRRVLLWATDRRAQVLLLPVVVGQSVYLIFGLQKTAFGLILGVCGWSAFTAYWLLGIRDRRRWSKRAQP